MKKILSNYKRKIILDPLFEYTDGIQVENFSQFVEVALRFPSSSIICRFADEESVEYVFQAVWEIGDCCLVVEEADMYIGLSDSFFNRLIGQGRHRAVSLICVSRRIPDLPPAFRAQCTTIITFAQHEENDLRRLKLLEFDTDVVRNLGKYQYATWGAQIPQIAN